uniref:Dol-P-Glc:Glc(2)Man(9)GlcNAc(2)-PP-Dol alpha-1,2-glucosyltransferase n=1 Tax=Anisakis simplex TaxID=6269 RepID=A0A0M3JRU5_ANISI
LLLYNHSFSVGYAIIVIFSVLHFILVRVLYWYVPEPYMDEIFHVNQTRRYCEGDYRYIIDSVISSSCLSQHLGPSDRPQFGVLFECGCDGFYEKYTVELIQETSSVIAQGSYIDYALQSQMLYWKVTHVYATEWIFWNEKITTPPALYVLTMLGGLCERERYINSLLWPVGVIGAIRFRRFFSDKLLVASSILVMHLSVLYQTSLLFYTDLFSLTLLLWAFSFENMCASSIAFLLAILTRQTNIVWAASFGVYHLLKRLDTRSAKTISTSLLRSIVGLLPLLSVGVGFVAFFILNDFNIVLGDHSAHRPVAHFMQLYYLITFMCFFAAPYIFFSNHLLQAIRDVFLNKPSRYLFYCICIALSVHTFTYEHDYLLADNRHFTFYIWRRWFRRHALCRYLLIPIYLICAKTIVHSIAHISRLLTLLFVVCVVLVLVPAHLLEPRYFIVPFVLWRLSVRETRLWVVLIEILYQLIINALVLYLFISKPFKWPSEPDNQQHFMW